MNGRLFVAVTVAACALQSLAAPAQGGVYDDVAAWWHLDAASSGTAVAGQIRDQRFWDTSGGAIATGVQGAPIWNAGTTAGPAGGQGYGNRALSVNAGDGASDGFSVNNFAVGGDVTLLMRVNWDGTTNGTGRNILATNGFNYSTDEGFLFEMTGAGGTPQIIFGQHSTTVVSSLGASTANTWYDLAITLHDDGANDTITFYRWGAGGALQKDVKVGNFFDGDANPTHQVRIGYEGGGDSGFHGLIEHTAMWSRALSEAEINYAFGFPQHAWTVGIENNSNADLRYEGAVDAAYSVGEPWHEARRAVTGGNSAADVSFQLTADEAALGHVYHLDMLSTDAGNPVQLAFLVNGHTIGTPSVTGGNDYTYFVPSAALQAGTNTFSIQYQGGAAWASWDWHELGGAWMVGYKDNNQAEFSSEGAAPDHFYVTDPNWLHLERAMTSSDREIFLHFELSDELASWDDGYYLYSTRIISQGGGNHPFDIYVNDTLLANIAASPDGTLLSLPVYSSMLQAGDNYIHLVYQDSSGWTQFDFHSFQAAVPEPSTWAMLLGLAAAGLVARVRRRKKA